MGKHNTRRTKRKRKETLPDRSWQQEQRVIWVFREQHQSADCGAKRLRKQHNSMGTSGLRCRSCSNSTSCFAHCLVRPQDACSVSSEFCLICSV